MQQKQGGSKPKAVVGMQRQKLTPAQKRKMKPIPNYKIGTAKAKPLPYKPGTAKASGGLNIKQLTKLASKPAVKKAMSQPEMRRAVKKLMKTMGSRGPVARPTPAKKAAPKSSRSKQQR